MQFINIQNERLSTIGIGSAALSGDRHAEQEAIRYGLSNGINVIDTAESYGDSEAIIGGALKGIPRDQYFLISKFLPQHATPDLMRRSLEGSLRRLGVDYLDLYLLHWRENANLITTVAELEKFKQAGLIRHWGVSNFDTQDMEDLLTVPDGDHVFANEDLYNLTSRGVEYDLLPWQQERQICFLSYSPFHAVGWNFIKPATTVKEIAHEHGVTPQQVMLAWLLRNHNVLPLPKAGQISHVQANIAAVDLVLLPADLSRLNTAYPAPTHKVPLDKI
ncbi:aldo/keto reductase [Limosilactobacillus caecicola]|uniref:aldo/keto reductase n=1 Tax=Limosilactobacillus caecicola TaxID=2941332 RepID=UPI00389904A7